MLRNFHRFMTIGVNHASKCVVWQEFRRHLYSPAPMGLLDFDREKQIWRNKIGHRKEDLLKRLKKITDDGDKMFTEDVTALLHLADNEEDFSLALKVLNRYKAMQDEQSFKSHFPVGETVLHMLYYYGKHDVAFKWFLNEKHYVVEWCRNRRCFLLMMDLLYEHERYEDVVTLLPVADLYFDRKHPELVTLVLAALHRMNTRHSLNQMLTVLNELCADPIQLPTRCAVLCSMLAYKQREVYLMMEILQLPVFATCSHRLISAIPNMKILSYIETGRLEEAVGILESAVVRFQKPVRLVFDEVLVKLTTAVQTTGNIELESHCKKLCRTLKAAEFVFRESLEEFMLCTIRFKEYDVILNTANPPKIYNTIRPGCDKLSLQETKFLT